MLKKILQFYSLLLLLLLVSSCNPLSSESFADLDLGLFDNAESVLCTPAAIDSQTFLSSQGNGSAANPYIICNVFQLQLMGNVDFEGNASILAGNTHLDGHFELGADIDASQTSTWTGGANGDGFIPIGALDTDYYGISVSSGFAGSFNGLSLIHISEPTRPY